MIGVFDSGFGGLVILKELDKQFPEYDFVYLGDNARAPYGTRSKEEVYEFTLQAVEHLFSRGCEIVILACNTASANALRRIQQEVLPKKYPEKRVLGILVPTIEQVTGVDWKIESATEESDKPHKVAVFATPGTVNSGAYELEIKKRNPSAEVFQIACPRLAGMIETGESEVALAREIGSHIEELKKLMRDQFPPDAVLLGCTHYPLVHDIFVKGLPSDVHVYDQAQMVAKSLKAYLKRNADIDVRIQKSGGRQFLTTAAPEEVQILASKFFGREVTYEHVQLG